MLAIKVGNNESSKYLLAASLNELKNSEIKEVIAANFPNKYMKEFAIDLITIYQADDKKENLSSS